MESEDRHSKGCLGFRHLVVMVKIRVRGYYVNEVPHKYISTNARVCVYFISNCVYMLGVAQVMARLHLFHFMLQPGLRLDKEGKLHTSSNSNKEDKLQTNQMHRNQIKRDR